MDFAEIVEKCPGAGDHFLREGDGEKVGAISKPIMVLAASDSPSPSSRLAWFMAFSPNSPIAMCSHIVAFILCRSSLRISKRSPSATYCFDRKGDPGTNLAARPELSLAASDSISKDGEIGGCPIPSKGNDQIY